MSRILIVNRRYCPGEAWTNRILAYAKGFAEAGEEVVLYYIITEKNRTRPDITISGVRITNLWETDGFFAKKFKIVSLLKNILRFTKMVNKGDRLFFYGGYGYQLWIASRVKKKAKVFCEITEHPQVFESSKSAYKINEWKIEMLKRIDGLFVISNSLKNYYIKKGIPEEKIHVINMFVDTNRFKGVQKISNEKSITYCGVVSYHKDGVDVLIKAFSLFHKTHRDFKLKIIGRGVSEKVMIDLRRLAESLEISEFVCFLGQVNPNQMPQLLYDASILALARPDSLQAQNGFPTKLGEYLATGNPVVVTSVGEIPHFLINGENAFLAIPGDTEDFAKCLSQVADNYDWAIQVGNRGKELSNEAFNYRVQTKNALRFM